MDEGERVNRGEQASRIQIVVGGIMATVLLAMWLLLNHQLREFRVDIGWLYSIAESSAAFVAIVAAFFTTKILTIASEMKTISNYIDLLNAEINERRSVAKRHKDGIDAVRNKWAEETIEEFYKQLEYELELGSQPSLEEIIQKFKKTEERSPDEYECRFLKERYENFLERLVKRVEKEARREALKKSSLGALIGFYNTKKSAFERILAREKLPYEVEREAKELDELNDKLDAEIDAISILNSRKQEYEEQLKALALPKYIYFGFFSFIYCVIVGVIMPLATALWSAELSCCIFSLIFMFFLSGLTTVFLYLYLEIRHAIGKKLNQ